MTHSLAVLQNTDRSFGVLSFGRFCEKSQSRFHLAVKPPRPIHSGVQK